jgi:DNA-directed RNA polymerases I, II, and III subunit RPABC2
MPPFTSNESFQFIKSQYDPSKNITAPVITKYEKAKMIGIRLEQIARGAPPMIDVLPGMSLREIVMKEFDEKKLPMLVMRTLPDGGKEYYKLDDLRA